MSEADVENYFRDLYELGVDPETELSEKIARAIEIGRDRLGVQYGVLSYTGDGEYEVVDSTITSGEYEAGTVHDLDTTWCRHVVDDSEVLAVADAGDSLYRDDVARTATGLQCYIGAPVLVDGEVYGTLCYSGDEPRATEFSEDEQHFVELLTRWVGYEIEREKHYTALDEQNDRLNEFAGVLTHDLRGPLTAARGYTELVAETAADPERDHLQTALDSLDRMEAMITETLELAQTGGDVGEREQVDLGDLAQQAWETVDPANATLTVESNRTVLADRSRLRQLLENLSRNVADHCGDGVTVTVRATDDGFSVEDDGPGLAPEIADSLFGGEFGRDRVGLGLLIVERVVSGHGWAGRVEVDGGTRFVFDGIGTVPDTYQ